MITICCACLMLNMWLQPVRMPKVLTVIVNLGGSFQGNFFPIWYLRLVKSQHFRLSMWQVPHHRSWPTSASSRLLGLRQMQVPFRLQTAMHQSYLKSVSGLRQPGSQCTRFPSENSSLSQNSQPTNHYLLWQGQIFFEAQVCCWLLPVDLPYVRSTIIAWTTSTWTVADWPASHCSKIWSCVFDCNMRNWRKTISDLHKTIM